MDAVGGGLFAQGDVDQAEKNLTEAVPLFKRELEGCIAQYGEQHNETRTSANNLHGIMVEMGNTAEAAELAARFNLLT